MKTSVSASDNIDTVSGDGGFRFTDEGEKLRMTESHECHEDDI